MMVDVTEAYGLSMAHVLRNSSYRSWKSTLIGNRPP
jgi:hypothetical protein